MPAGGNPIYNINGRRQQTAVEKETSENHPTPNKGLRFRSGEEPARDRLGRPDDAEAERRPRRRERRRPSSRRAPRERRRDAAKERAPPKRLAEKGGKGHGRVNDSTRVERAKPRRRAEIGEKGAPREKNV